MYIIISKIMDLEKRLSIFTPITARVKTKTIILYGTWLRGQYSNFTILLDTHS